MQVGLSQVCEERVERGFGRRFVQHRHVADIRHRNGNHAGMLTLHAHKSFGGQDIRQRAAQSQQWQGPKAAEERPKIGQRPFGLLAQGHGGVGIVSSVAGLSGLPKALVYGPTKAALINLCESLYFDLHPRGHAVYMINPGFVATPATAQNTFVMPGLISAGRAAEEIVTGMEKGVFHLHFPKGFTNWLRMARLLPYRWYFSLIHKVTGL